MNYIEDSIETIEILRPSKRKSYIDTNESILLTENGGHFLY